MARKWRIRFKDGDLAGPFSETEIRKKIRLGEVSTDDDLVQDIPEKAGDLLRAHPTSAPQTRRPHSFERGIRKQVAKKFFLIDSQKRKLGPLAPKEIESLYYRGLIDKSVFVFKANSQGKVPLHKFLEVYGKGKNSVKNLEFSDKDPRVHWSYPSLRVMDEIAKEAAQKSYAYAATTPHWVYVLIGVLLGALIVVVPKILAPSTKTPATEISPSVIENYEHSAEPEKLQAEPVQVQKKPPDEKKKTIKAKPAPAPKQPLRSKRSANPSPKARATPSRQRQTPPSASQSSPAMNLRQSSPQASPGQRASPPAQPASNYIDGQVTTIRNARYQLRDLQNCADRCELSFTDPSGQRIVAIFFKSQYLQSLAQARGQAHFTGRIRRDARGLSMILQQVSR
jgi:hypothetical protein